MNARNLAEVIANYLEADDSSNGSTNGSSMPAMTDGGTQRQLQQLAQKTDQLQQDTAGLKQDMTTMKNNLQMSAILPLLMSQSLKLSSATDSSGNPYTFFDNFTFNFQDSDPVTALLPMLLMGGMGDSSGSGSDSGSNMLLLALALSGKL